MQTPGMPSQKTVKGQPFGRWWLLDEMGRFAFGPRIVSHAQVDAVGNGGVIEEEKDVDRIGVGVDENGFAVDLEGARECLTRVRNDAVGDFEAVDIGLIFLIAAESIADDIGGETQESQEQEKRGEGGPIVERADSPGSAGAREEPADGAVAEIEKKENNRGGK